MKSLKKSGFLILTMVFIFHLSFFGLFCLSCVSSSDENLSSIEDIQDSSVQVVRLAPDVTDAMLDSSFWISRVKNPRKIKMSRPQIAAWNRNVKNIRFPPESNFFIVSDLQKFDSVMTGSEIRGEMIRKPGGRWFKKSTGKNGTEILTVTKKEWDAIFDEMNYSNLESSRDFPVRKAVCVRRSNLRLIPDDTFYTDDSDYWYDDTAQTSGILMNEPVLVLCESKSKKWLYVKCSYCTGWIHASDIAFCSDEDFAARFDYAEKKQASFVTVKVDSFDLPKEYLMNLNGQEASDSLTDEISLFMGTYLFTSDWNRAEFDSVLFHRTPYANFIVEIPLRKSDGTLGKTYACVPASICTLGLLDYTVENTLELAFETLGKHYGWGGMAESRDCSEYLKDIFRCFGFTFPRNSRTQLAMCGKTIYFDKKSISDKKSLLSSVEPGSVLGFPGHVFMYLGKVADKHYVISALGSYYFDSDNSDESLFKVDANSVSINTLEMKRKSGDAWLDLLTRAKLLYDDGSLVDNRIFLDSRWKYADFSKINSGKSFLYRSTSKNRKNIVVAVNAGHGTKGGSLQKTFSHPDKSPKVTGGTNAKGALESIAVSDGMTFSDGKTEAEVTLRTARIFKNLLLKAGYDVLMIRDSDDTQLDNIARTVISNNNAQIHIAIHFDLDGKKEDKGCFYCSIPDALKTLETVKKHWKESEFLGESLIQGLKDREMKIFNDGRFETDLTQTSFSTIPTVDIELGNQCTDTNTKELEKRAKALVDGVELFFEKKQQKSP